MSEHLYTDVLIVGGSLIGGTLACTLATGGLKSIVIDKAFISEQDTQQFDGRATAIAYTGKNLLEAINIWPSLKNHAAPILDIRVADQNSKFFLHFDHTHLTGEPLGYMVENRILRRAIFRESKKFPEINYLMPVELVEIDRRIEGITTRLEDGRIIHSALIVGSDGRGSSVREHANIPVTQWSYKQTSIVCTVNHEKPHDNIAHEHFFAPGPFAILPLTGRRSSIVWTEDREQAQLLLSLPHDEFLEELSLRFGDFLGSLKIVGPKSHFPLSLHYAKNCTARRLALVGDSSHGLHPVAGQGLNMGFRDVAALAEVLVDTYRLGLDIGTPNCLKQYERWRRFDNTLMLAATDGLNRLFSNNISSIQLMRNLGLAAVNASGGLKKLFMRQAMGLTGNLPRIMKGETL